MSRTIEIVVSPTGETRLQTKGFSIAPMIGSVNMLADFTRDKFLKMFIM